MRTLALELAPDMIRVNSVHPTSVDTDMIQNAATYELFGADLPVDQRTKEVLGARFQELNALPIPWVEPVDISNAVLWLASDEARYVTGVTLPIDAGSLHQVKRHQTTRETAAADLARTYQRVAARLVGRERELTLVLAAVAAGRDIILEGPPGTSKTTLLRAITAEWDIPLVFVEGNADLTPAKLVGHHNPARVLREDYSADNFVDGPLLEAMRGGGFLYIEEFNRAPEDTLNTLLTAMAERRVAVPRAGRSRPSPRSGSSRR